MLCTDCRAKMESISDWMEEKKVEDEITMLINTSMANMNIRRHDGEERTYDFYECPSCGILKMYRKK